MVSVKALWEGIGSYFSGCIRHNTIERLTWIRKKTLCYCVFCKKNIFLKSAFTFNPGINETKLSICNLRNNLQYFNDAYFYSDTSAAEKAEQFRLNNYGMSLVSFSKLCHLNLPFFFLHKHNSRHVLKHNLLTLCICQKDANWRSEIEYAKYQK